MMLSFGRTADSMKLCAEDGTDVTNMAQITSVDFHLIEPRAEIKVDLECLLTGLDLEVARENCTLTPTLSAESVRIILDMIPPGDDYNEVETAMLDTLRGFWPENE